MSKYAEGAAALTKFSVQFKALAELGDALREVASLEQAANEAQARRDAVEREAADHESRVVAARAALDALKAQSQQHREQAESEAAAKREDLRALIEKELTEGRIRMAQMSADHAANHANAVKASKAQIEQLQGEAASHRTAIDELVKQSQAAKLELDRVQSRLANVKAEIANFVKG